MVINIILVIFPILIYYLFSSCNILFNKMYSKLFLIVTLFTSLYLSLTYTYVLNYRVLLFCNVPVMVAYIRKEKELALLLSMIVLIASYDLYSVNIYIAIIKYALYFIIYIIFIDKRNYKDYFLILVTIIQGFFISFEYFTLDNIVQIIGIIIIMYVITFLVIYILNLADNMTDLYKNMHAYVNQEKIKNSLFKLTHEIKNPIAVCKGYLDMVNLDDTDKVHKYIPIVKSEIDRSLNIMSDFMEYSKIKLDLNMIDLTMLLDDIYKSFSILLVNNSIKLNYNNNYDELYINGDYDRLKQVFVNIIKNSVEAIQKDGIINIEILMMKNKARIKIIDNGVGMSRDSINHITEMFYTTKRNGTGLGVSLSNEIINLHGGTLKYDSVENVGTTCTITLPILRM